MHRFMLQVILKHSLENFWQWSWIKNFHLESSFRDYFCLLFFFFFILRGKFSEEKKKGTVDILEGKQSLAAGKTGRGGLFALH